MRHLRRMFNYDYRSVDLFMLREAGVRTFREVEEVIEGRSFTDRIPGPGNFARYTGFTRASKPLEVTIKEIAIKGVDIDIQVLDVHKPSVDEIIYNFCRHCRFKNHT